MADSFKNLEVWKKAMALAKATYTLTADFPKEEIYGLTSQIRKCAISVPSNIAEGSARRAPKEFIRFLNIAEGSLAELETQLILAGDLGFLNSSYIKKSEEEITAIGKMLSGLRKSVEGKEKL